jgi:recombination protein RecA
MTRCYLLTRPLGGHILTTRIKGEFGMAAAFPLGWRHVEPLDTLSAAGRDFPRGRISEIIGTRSSGRTSVVHALLAASTGQGEFAALVDTKDAFDACSAASAGVDLSKLVWVRCGGNAEHALRAADLLIQAGGFGVVALDLAEATPAALNRIPPTAWFRFRRALESTPTILAVLADCPLAKSCSCMTIKMPPRRAVFTGQAPFLLLRDAS